MVQRQRGANSQGLWGLSGNKLVEPVGDRHIFHNVHRVQNIRPGGRHGDPNAVRLRHVVCWTELHLSAELACLVRGNVHTDDAFDVLHSCFGQPRRQEGSRFHLVHLSHWGLIDHIHWLHGEGCRAVLREHGDHRVQHDVGLGEVCRCALDEHVPGGELDARVVAVDDRWKGEDRARGIPHHGIHRRVHDQGHVRREVLAGRVSLVVLQQGSAGPDLVLLCQRHKLDVLWWLRAVREGARYDVEVVGADGDQLPPAANVLVKFVLEVDEGLVHLLVKGEVTQDSADHKGPDLLGRGPHAHNLSLRRLHDLVDGRALQAFEDEQGSSDAFNAQEIIAVRRDVDLVDHRVI
mmetsp:Transcript_29442/g.85832  ORF Transcript_29442/g.85832 Transcript_29442/m.85832 type:complete len:349 (+) Transcript_29442:774-1820(+)